MRAHPARASLILVAQICASILGREGWSPVLTVVAICITIQSMLASCKVGTPTVNKIKIPLTSPVSQKKEPSASRVCLCIWPDQACAYPRPSDNDRYVPRAPENPKKVSTFLLVSPQSTHHIVQARFHYHGTSGRNTTQCTANLPAASIKTMSTDTGLCSLLFHNADHLNASV